jgi:adenosylcobinamide-GDP ribazoletransferase
VLASLVLAVALGLVLVGPAAMAWACLLGAGIVWSLTRLARTNGAINGDFIGAAVVAVELASCLAGLL